MSDSKIRNFSIIAHIDHGKSTLADRLLEETGTIEKRRMKEQFLDMMELERERGITIKMQPVTMKFPYKGEIYTFNLIDTPGHIDFSYEVSRALKAVEGVILLVDATQGVQAQTFTVLAMAQELGLAIIPVLNKIDLPIARPDEVREEMASLLGCEPEEILAVSGKTGEGVKELLEAIVERVPAPITQVNPQMPRALVFDFEYSTHKGVIVYVRLLDGLVKKGDQLVFQVAQEKFTVLETGVFTPTKFPTASLEAGGIGYLVTGIKERGQAKVGETITKSNSTQSPVEGYSAPKPVVWASVYPESQDDFTLLKQALERLNLQDAALSFEEEFSGSLGRGFRCGFLGMLHLEIITERLRREYELDLIVTTPTISYEIVDEKSGEKITAYSPHLFPLDTKGKKIFEPWVSVKIITPASYLNSIIPLFHEHEAIVINTESFGDNRTKLDLEMPLRELMRNFFDEIKSVSSGFASLSYEIIEKREADVERLDVLLCEELVPAFSRIVPKRRIQREAEEMADKLKELLPRQLIVIKIQVQGLGRILSARAIPALRKDVTGYLYGGDITRKRKLWEKQKKGKKKMQKMGKVNVPHEVFIKMMKNGQ